MNKEPLTKNEIIIQVAQRLLTRFKTTANVHRHGNAMQQAFLKAVT